MIIDAHTHYQKDEFEVLINEFLKSEIDAINIISVRGLYEEKYIKEKVNKLTFTDKNIYITAGISLDDFDKIESIKKYYKGYDLLKIHPRIQKYDNKEIYKIIKNLKDNKIEKPIIIDMFPYRNENYEIKNYNPLLYEKILNDFSSTKFVFAHFGGIYLREVFMMMKCYKNLYADTSLITRYFKNSPIEEELFYFIKRLKGDRVLFGSDYPEIGLQENLELHRQKMLETGIERENIDKVLGLNFRYLIK